MKRWWAVCMAGLISTCAWSADLLDVYHEAVANDARFAAARAKQQAGHEAEVQAQAGLLPGVGLSAVGARNRAEPDGASRQNYTSYSWGVQLTQPLFRMQNLVRARQGRLQTVSADLEWARAHQDLMLRVSEAYFNVLNAQDALAAVSQLKQATKEQLEIASASFEVGTVTVIDVHEARSRHDLASSQVIVAESELDVRKYELAEIIGKPSEPLAGLLAGVQIMMPQPDSLSSWASAAELGSLNVQLKQLANEIAAQEVSHAKAGHFPTLDLVASHGLSARQSSYAAPHTTSTSLGVQFNVPLYEGGSIDSRVRETLALKTKSEADMESARRVASLAAREAYLGVVNGIAQVKALEAAETSSASSLESNRLGYDVGVRINIDVLNAQSQLADTQRELAQTRYNTMLAQLRLKAAAGALSEDDLRALNALLKH